MASHCERARQGQGFGLQTIVCIPSADGVIELGSTELIFQSADVMKKVKVSFNFSGDLMQINTIQPAGGDNDPSSIWLTDPVATSTVTTDIAPTKDSVDVIGSQRTSVIPSITSHVPNPSSSSLPENSRYINNPNRDSLQNQGVFGSRDLNFSEFGSVDRATAGRSGNTLYPKPESGRILDFSESKRSSTNNAALFSDQSQFLGAGENNNINNKNKNKKKRLPGSCGSNEDGMLSFVSGVLPSSSMGKSDGGAFTGADPDHSDLDASIIREVEEDECRDSLRSNSLFSSSIWFLSSSMMCDKRLQSNAVDQKDH